MLAYHLQKVDKSFKNETQFHENRAKKKDYDRGHNHNKLQIISLDSEFRKYNII